MEWKAGDDDRILTVRGILVDRVEVSSSTKDDAFSAPYPDISRRQPKDSCLPTEFRHTKADLEDIAMTLTGGKREPLRLCSLWYAYPLCDQETGGELYSHWGVLCEIYHEWGTVQKVLDPDNSLEESWIELR